MAKIQINNVVVLNNPALFSSPLQFEITFDCTENLEVSCYIDLKIVLFVIDLVKVLSI